MPLKRKTKKKESKIAYTCGVNFQHDLCDDNAHTIEFYGSVEALKKHCKCTHECGIVKVKVTLEKWVLKQDFSNRSKS
jgi:hypothetical protein